MAKKSKKEAQKSAQASDIKLVRKNKKAFFRFHIVERLEAGIMLKGTEVKSLRAGNVSLDEAYGRIQGNELWLIGSHIDEYERKGYASHSPKRPRKLLVHKRELKKLEVKIKERGFTLVPLSIYFKKALAKIEMGLGRGKKLVDKREGMKKRDADREIRRAMSQKSR